MGAKQSKSKRTGNKQEKKYDDDDGNVIVNIEKPTIQPLSSIANATAQPKLGTSDDVKYQHLTSLKPKSQYRKPGFAHRSAKTVDTKESPYAEAKNEIEYDLKDLLVTGYIRLVIFVLFADDDEDDDDDDSIMHMIPGDVIKMCEQYYEANMILFKIQSCYDHSALNGIECINLNCKKIVRFRTVLLEHPDTLASSDQHWFDKTVSTLHLPNIVIPEAALLSYSDTLQQLQKPSMIVKCNLSSWRQQHTPSIILFDSRLLGNWSFAAAAASNTDVDVGVPYDNNTKEIDAYEMALPVIATQCQSLLKAFVYSADHGLFAATNDKSRFTLHRLDFSDKTQRRSWRWEQVEQSPRNVVGISVVEPPDLQHGKSEKLFMLSLSNEQLFRWTENNERRGAKTATLTAGYFDVEQKRYSTLCSFQATGKATYGRYGQKPAPTSHPGHLWIQPSLYYNKSHKKVFIGGDDSRCVEGWDVLTNSWMFLPQTQYVHSKGCSVWSLVDQGGDILYIDKGVKSNKGSDNFIEFFDLRSDERQWRLSEHYMQWNEISQLTRSDIGWASTFESVYRKTFI